MQPATVSTRYKREPIHLDRFDLLPGFKPGTVPTEVGMLFQLSYRRKIFFYFSMTHPAGIEPAAIPPLAGFATMEHSGVLVTQSSLVALRVRLSEIALLQTGYPGYYRHRMPSSTSILTALLWDPSDFFPLVGGTATPSSSSIHVRTQMGTIHRPGR